MFVDESNIRWKIYQPSFEDFDMVKSIKKLGVVQNLIVRPFKEGDKVKYGIICGSRRYLAALRAGLKKIPCRILDLDDISAMGLSFTENENRRDIPRWRVIDWIVEMYEKIRDNNKDESKILTKLSKKSALSKQTIRKYLMIGSLPSDVKILLKKDSERTEIEKEKIKRYIAHDYKTELTMGVAELIAINLIDIPENKLFQHTIELTRFPYDGAKIIIDHLKENLDRTIDEIVEALIRKSTKYRSITLQLKSELYSNLEDLCLERRIKLHDLILNLIKEGLKTY